MSARRFTVIVMLGLLAAGASAQPASPTVQPPPTAPAPASPFALPPAQIDNSLSVGGEDVKAEEVETRLSVDVLVNGQGPYKFIVDSGADTSVVGLGIARKLELPLGTPAILNGMTERNIVDRVRVEQLSLGTSTFNNLQLPALRESDLGGDGMIGIDALVQQRLMLDFEGRLIKVEDARIPEKHYPNEIVVTAYRKRGQLILTHVKAAGFPLDAVIDTGSEITIGNLALRDKLVRKHRANITKIAVTGVTGATVDLELARISELQLGPIIFHDVPMAFADVPPFKAFGLSDQPALLLGTDLLESFRRVSLDFRSRKVRFQLRRCKEQAISISTWSNAFTRLSSTGTPDVCAR